MEILTLKERVKNILSLGESHFREFKSAYQGPNGNKVAGSIKELNKYIAEALVAFANADGGVILIGVEDNGYVTGLPFNEKEVSALLNGYKSYIHRDSKLPIENEVKLDNIHGKTILFFSVSKGMDDIFQLSDGRCVCRKDKETIPISFNKIQFERNEVKSRAYDREFCYDATVNDLDVTLIQSISNSYIAGLSVEYYLQQTGLAEFEVSSLKLRRAALLLFAKDITKWHTRCQIRILQIAGNDLKSGKDYNVVNDEIVTGNIFYLLTTAWEKLRPFLAYKTEFGAEAKFEQKFIYPEEAVREALVNAITHRDYTIQNGIDIFIFNDRLEIKSPGLLLSTINIEDLKKLQGHHESRNTLTARVLRENKIVRELGEGMKRIFTLLHSQEMDKPELLNQNSSFSIILNNKSIFSASEEAYLNMFKNYEISPLQKRIIILGIKSTEISPSDIYKAMNTTDRDTYDKEVTSLRRLGILKEIRTNSTATILSRKTKISKQKIGRYKIQNPK
ncbi:hypothetical protein OK18_04640 [Chryseobacterium gallinarum]|uniref:Schlafen AlbA-2 domain-containing protein n=1 Tax=Chryseobacterium gallinarum TaxID=1324352 RepID=A0A0G3M4T6_CHRGL|nr:ATP-binding protein [Chryseobacterium gallinarum]AKK72017.1 hypothetical protein OK18_04640 [Chryseobacterium gallinarum]